jgi:hypothetical protein
MVALCLCVVVCWWWAWVGETHFFRAKGLEVHPKQHTGHPISHDVSNTTESTK